MHTVLKIETVYFGDGYLWRPEVAVVQILPHYLFVCNTPGSGVTSVVRHVPKQMLGRPILSLFFTFKILYSC
jgi:hypothetical protein